VAISVEVSKAEQAQSHGKFIGKTTPCRETKYTWFEVYEYENELIACACCENNGVFAGEKIGKDELQYYKDD
jgi:hypothetical protein